MADESADLWKCQQQRRAGQAVGPCLRDRARLDAVLRSAGRFGDLSYGLYLYAFPMQQLVLTLFPQTTLPVILCTALTAPLALLSWHLIERPALRWRALGRSARPEPAQQPARG